MARFARRWLPAFLLLPLLGGCSEPSGPRTMRVWGDVGYDGVPVDEGTIDFLSPDGSTPAQAAIRSGHYDLPAESGPVAGKAYRVEVSRLVKSGKSVRNVMPDGAPTMDVLENAIPAAYNARSNLSVTVSEDESRNQFDFHLAKVPGKEPSR